MTQPGAGISVAVLTHNRAAFLASSLRGLAELRDLGLEAEVRLVHVHQDRGEPGRRRPQSRAESRFGDDRHLPG